MAIFGYREPFPLVHGHLLDLRVLGYEQGRRCRQEGIYW